MATGRHIVRENRELQKLSGRQLAAKAGVCHSYLNRYERGVLKKEPSQHWLTSISLALGTNLAELTAGKS